MESFSYDKLKRTSKIMHDLTQHFRAKVNKELEIMKSDKLTRDQKNMIKLFQSMTKLQQYKTIRQI